MRGEGRPRGRHFPVLSYLRRRLPHPRRSGRFLLAARRRQVHKAAPESEDPRALREAYD